MNYPLVNTFLLGGVILLVSVLFAWLLLNSFKWTGPSHSHRFRQLETDRDHDRHRIFQLEENSNIQFREITTSIEGLSKDIKQVAMSLSMIAGIPNRVVDLESRRTDTEQVQQFFKDVGCGYADCPRWNGKLAGEAE